VVDGIQSPIIITTPLLVASEVSQFTFFDLGKRKNAKKCEKVKSSTVRVTFSKKQVV
jgi:hypothetical protein